MNTPIASELQRFGDFVCEKLSNGGAHLSPEEVLDEWRARDISADDLAASIAALQKALSEMEAGDRGVPLAEFDHDFRNRHPLPPTL